MTKIRQNDPLHHEIGSLLRRCQQGDDAAWSQLVDRFQSLVYSIAKRTGLNQDDCSDVFQATFVALHRSLDRLNDAAALPKWLAVTASRESLRLKRVNSRTVNTSSEALSLEETLVDEEMLSEDIATAALESAIVRNGVAELAPKCRELLTLLYLTEDVSYDEVSARTGMAIGSIGPTRARCLEKLRVVITKLEFFDDTVYQNPAELTPF